MNPFPGINRPHLAQVRAERATKASDRRAGHAQAVLARRDMHVANLKARHAELLARRDTPKPNVL